ncbi:hypothetical protein [Bradyrhizobium sp. SRS-191]|uniref:hypothetical protein n=1 Tax=Bradyrhizobium sp. SRS-191 TaxID=2962606 RepID=UPI00211F0C34|nr:hypothetical protein [Bradyrhizobium sp. SRS-191]
MTASPSRPMRPALSVHIHDAHLGIWQDNANDPTLRTAIYAPLIRAMTKRGWSIKADPQVLQHYRSISRDHRLGTSGTLHCAIRIAGRVVEIEFWSETAPQINCNGRRYDSDKLRRMAYLDRLRVELEFRRVAAWLGTLAPVIVSRTAGPDEPALQRIARGYAESWHTDKALGRPRCDYDSNRRSADGALLEHGQTVWIADRRGRIVRGTAYYHINSMWWVVAGGELFNQSCGSLHTSQPADLRAKLNTRARRKRLEGELALAVQRMAFRRAELLKAILFGAEPIWMIWARDKHAWYRAQYQGYTDDRISAGKYTKAEAEAECRRVPHELEMVGPDGVHVRFDPKPAQICAGQAGVAA